MNETKVIFSRRLHLTIIGFMVIVSTIHNLKIKNASNSNKTESKLDDCELFRAPVSLNNVFFEANCHGKKIELHYEVKKGASGPPPP